jgi:hypothetical protein
MTGSSASAKVRRSLAIEVATLRSRRERPGRKIVPAGRALPEFPAV